jgi:hypothetical protein
MVVPYGRRVIGKRKQIEQKRGEIILAEERPKHLLFEVISSGIQEINPGDTLMCNNQGYPEFEDITVIEEYNILALISA